MSDERFEGFTPYDSNPSPEPPVLLEEEGNRPWGPGWSLLWTFAVLCIWYLAQLALVAVLSFRESGKDGLSEEGMQNFLEAMSDNGDLLGVVSSLAALIGCVMIVAIVRSKGVSLADGLALRRPKKWWMWLLVFPTWIAGMRIIILIVSPFQSDKAVVDQAGIASMVEGTNYLVLLLLGVAVGAPFFEEFLFRGLLHEGLRQSFLGPVGSGILTALFFSVMHQQYQDPAAFLTLFLLGILFTLARELSGSLWLAVVMHAIQNTMVTVMMFLTVHGYIPDESIPEDLREVLEQKEDLETGAPALEPPSP